MRFTFCVIVAICLFGTVSRFMAERPPSGAVADHQSTSIEIFGVRNSNSDQPASATATIADVNVGPNGSLSFSPNPVNIVVGDTIRWTWKSFNHTVTSGSPCTVDSAYCSPSDTNCTTAAASSTNAVYSHTFGQAGSFPYFCRVHCGFGMTGTVNVLSPFITVSSLDNAANAFTVNGQTTATTVATNLTVRSSSNLVSGFSNPLPVTANNTGVFTFTDASAGIGPRFYQLTYP